VQERRWRRLSSSENVCRSEGTGPEVSSSNGFRPTCFAVRGMHSYGGNYMVICLWLARLPFLRFGAAGVGFGTSDQQV
jgi:hypothetical protein